MIYNLALFMKKTSDFIILTSIVIDATAGGYFLFDYSSTAAFFKKTSKTKYYED